MIWSLITASLPVVAALTLLSTSQDYSLATTACVLAISAYGFQIAYGQIGLMFLTHGALYGVGAYTAGLLALHADFGFWQALPLAMLFASGVAVVIGIPSMRVAGQAFLVLTFTFTLIAEIAANNFDELTKGTDGLVLVATRPHLGPIDFVTTEDYFWLALAGAYFALLVAAIVAHSRFGLRFAAIRENAQLARAVGIDVFGHRLVALALEGALAGMAGVFYIYYLRAIEPSQFTIWATAQTTLVVLLGGRHSLAGPAVGALIVIFLPEVLNLGPTTAQLVYGWLIVILILFLPQGIAGSIAQAADYWRGFRTQTSDLMRNAKLGFRRT